MSRRCSDRAKDVNASWIGTIVFIHGKESTPETSSTARAIREHFAGQTVLVPDYRPLERSHEEIEQYLADYLKAVLDKTDDVFRLVGISLGGYWAYTMACKFRQIGYCVMLNPSFRCYPGTPVMEPSPGLPITLISNLDDEVVNAQDAIELFSGRAEIITFEHGGHRFSNREEMLKHLERTLTSFLCH